MGDWLRRCGWHILGVLGLACSYLTLLGEKIKSI